jgi:hypothetical protein
MSRMGARGKEEAQASFPRRVPFFCGGVGAGFFGERKAPPPQPPGRVATEEKQGLDILCNSI